ncbi:MAG: NUDIX domain-containing protein [Actinomycetota bacterium]|nr:NUDIX domain-containing protein [Actinomycetota bacterium]
MINASDRGNSGRSERDVELLDVFGPGGVYVTSLPRWKVHEEGLWHQVFHCLVVRSGRPARVLLQRRRSSSNAFPGMLDLSATGHLLAGEEPVDGIRELREETGLDASRSRLVSLGRRLLVDDSGEGLNREIVHAFLLTDDTPLGDLRLDPGEVAGFVELTIHELLLLLADPARSVAAFEVDPAGSVRRVECRGAELVPAVDGYWTVLATMAERYVAGVRQLGV